MSSLFLAMSINIGKRGLRAGEGDMGGLQRFNPSSRSGFTLRGVFNRELVRGRSVSAFLGREG